MERPSSLGMRKSPPTINYPYDELTLRVNIYTGDPEERNMRTGRHTVRDVYCEVCHTVLGWKYVRLHRYV